MPLDTISTATPEEVLGKGYDIRKPQRYSEARRETTTPLIIIIGNPHSVSCEADHSCNITIDYNEAESQRQPEDIFAAYGDILDTSTNMPLKGIDLLEDKYVIDHRPAIAAFLNEHTNLDRALIETHAQIKRIFGEHIVEIVLSLNKDAEEDYTGLSITVKTSLKTRESLTLLDKFDEEWWLDLEAEIRNTVTVMVRSA